MSGCILRVGGKHLTAPPALNAVATHYGFYVEVSRHEEFRDQVAEAEAFVTDHWEVIRRLAEASGCNVVTLDFGVWNKAPEVVSQAFSLPRSLVAASARCGVGLEISVYLPARSASGEPP